MAAKEALRKLEDQLMCGICHDSYTEPKLLQCLHVFCKQCLEQLVVRDRQGLFLHCPSCRQSTLLPSTEVSGLQTAFYLNNLFDVRNILEKIKEPQKKQCEKCKKCVAINFCHDCGKLICARCTETHQEWLSSHKVITLDQLEDVTQLIPQQKKMFCSKHQSKELDLYCEKCEELVCRDCTVRIHRDHQYDLVADAFQKHKDVLVSSKQPVEQQLDTVTKSLQHLHTRCQQITDQREALVGDICKTIQQLQEALEIRKTELIGQLDQIGQQKLKTLAAQRDQLELVQAKANSWLDFVKESLQTGSEREILAMKKPVVKQVEVIAAEFKEVDLEPQERADITFSVDALDLTRECQQFGEVHRLAFHLMDLSTPIKIIDGLSNPWDVAVNRKGEIIVAECSGHCISIFSSNGRWINTVGEGGSEDEQFVEPRGVEVDGDDNILVADGGNDRIQKFTAHGKFLAKVGEKGTKHLEFKNPTAVAVNHINGKLYICDRQNHRIQILKSDLTFSGIFGSYGSDEGQFNCPRDVAFDSTGNVYVADTEGHRVQVFTAEGKFLRRFGKKGGGDGELKFPSSVSIGSNDMVYVSERNNNRISMFTSDGHFMRSFGTWGKRPGQFNSPHGIAVDREGHVYVCDTYNCCVKKF